MKKLLHEFYQKFIPDLSSRRFLPIGETLRRYYYNRNIPFTKHSLSDLRKKRKDILFILGSNRSINEITDREWTEIGKHDSLGFNYWIFHKFVPTYFSLEYGSDPEVNKYHMECLQRRVTDYKNTIFFVHSRERRRGMSPWLLPEYYPPNPHTFFYTFPPLVKCPVERPFRCEDFKSSIFYRGSLNLNLHVARLLGYRCIVLVGCEMDTSTTFYEDYPEAQWIFQLAGYVPSKEERGKIKYGGAYDSKGKHNFIKLILAINKCVLRPEGIKLYVYNKKSLLYPEIPLFRFD